MIYDSTNDTDPDRTRTEDLHRTCIHSSRVTLVTRVHPVSEGQSASMPIVGPSCCTCEPLEKVHALNVQWHGMRCRR